MTKISANVIADSKNPFGQRLTTVVVTIPRFILAELNTHRMMSRNSASSRAIPFEKMIKSVDETPFMPMAWQQDHKGMQGSHYFTEEGDIKILEHNWLAAKAEAVHSAKKLAVGNGTVELTKQLCNRLLEPYMWHTVIITASEWTNFFALRCPKYQFEIDGPVFRSRKDLIDQYCGDDNDLRAEFESYSVLEWCQMNKGQAEIHMMELAEQIWDAMNESTPKELEVGEWHIPFGDKMDTGKVMEYFDKNGFSHMTNVDYQNAFIKIATARCARVSYTVVGEEGKEPNYENDIKLHDNLLKAGHMSPFEHIAQVMHSGSYYGVIGGAWSGNFKGFIQYRKTLPGENITN